MPYSPQKPIHLTCRIHLKNLEVNKACGLDGIEHLKCGADRLYKLLGSCITSLLVHGILPESMLGVILVPVIKDKFGIINAKNNYRPIALANIVSKVVENILLDRMSIFLVTRPNQFGFKTKHGTDIFFIIYLPSSNRITHSAESAVTNAGSWQQYTKYP